MSQVEFFGEQFTLREKVSEYAYLKFARAAAAGTDADSAAGVAAMLNLLEKCIVPAEWPRFDKLAEDNDASTEDIIAVIGAAFSQVTGRPTVRPSDSSDGPTSIGQKSDANSVDKDLLARPDLQLMVNQARSVA